MEEVFTLPDEVEDSIKDFVPEYWFWPGDPELHKFTAS